MSNWKTHGNITELLSEHYKNPESSWAKAFSTELLGCGFADRNLRAIQMRYNKIGITLHFQAKIENGLLLSRFITK